ncbi:MAG TPA: OmpH family outer membrane protein [Candidatus Dormibacteraeota bacterium]|nr:OmpH family outer membrane protein [Candidatus Dormibacteraeota bacterium]
MWALAGVIVALLAGAVSARADIKIGFIDSDRIFAEYPKTREAQESFNREVQELSKTAKEKKTEIDELQRKLDQQGPMLSEAKKDEQNREVQRKLSEYETFVQTNWGPGGRISKLNEEYLKPIVDRVHAIVAEFGTEEGYSLILDAADGNVVFGDKALDLTDRVLLALRQEDEGTRRTTPKTNQGSGTNQNSGNQGQQ